MSKLRVALIGAGIARAHIAGFAANIGLFDLPVLCSLDPERGRPMAEKHGIPDFTTSFDEVLERDDIDVIDICTPPNSHFELSEKSLRAGKHVICEKPLFGSIEEVDRMEGIVAETGRTLMPIFQYRFGAGVQKLRHLIALDLTGEAFLTSIETHWWRGPDYYAVPWRGKWATELGGGLLGHAIHAHDMLNYVHGPSSEAFAYGKTLVNPIEVEDTMALSVKMRNGSIASLSVTLGSREEISRLRFCFRNLVAESNRAPYNFDADPWTFIAGDAAHQKRIDDALKGFEPHEDGYARQFALFHEALASDGELPVTLLDARNALELVTAGYCSQRTGIPCRLPITPDHPLYKSWQP